MAERIVLVTAGGHISAFHAAMMAMYEALQQKEAYGRFELFGAVGGLSGLVNGKLEIINPGGIEEFRAGSLIGADREKVSLDEIAKAVKDNGIYAIVMMGGDDHLGTAAKWHEAGIHVVGYPKTMDGDLDSYISLGWNTAVTVGSEFVKLHHNSAMTNRRVFYVGLFGRDTDWVLCPVTAYGCGDIGIPCEKPYEIGYILDRVAKKVAENNERYKVPFAVVPFSEGASIGGLNPIPGETVVLDGYGHPKLQPEWLGMELVRLSKARGIKACFQCHTYDMRDSPPTEMDRIKSREAGTECIRMILEADFGKSVAFELDACGKIVPKRVPLAVVAKKRKLTGTGYFDYGNLVPTQKLWDDYAPFFREFSGSMPAKDEMVYRNMLGHAKRRDKQ